MTPVTHGRHCPCSACAREDWTNPKLAHCGMHGPDCPRKYDPYASATQPDAAKNRDNAPEPSENVVLLQRLDAWSDSDANPGPLIRWAAAHLRQCIGLQRNPLDAAWAAVAAALPDGWAIDVLTDGPGYRADAKNMLGEVQLTGWSDGGLSDGTEATAPRPTPAAALRSLADALTQRGTPE